MRHHNPTTSNKRITSRRIINIMDAMNLYKMEYGKYPLQIELLDHTYNDDRDLLLASLLGDRRATQYNPRQIIFLPKFTTQKPFEDAWGNNFIIMADWNSDSSLQVGTNKIIDSVVVWSFGPDGNNDYGLGDDLGSWNH